VGGVLVKPCIIAIRRSTFLKEKEIHHVIKFSFLFELTFSWSQLYNSTEPRLQTTISQLGLEFYPA